MIGQLRGHLAAKQPPYLLVDVAGVGYEIQASMTTFSKLPELGQPIVLYTHLIVREDALLLCGFYEQRERALFQTLIKVNGIGAKLALTILSSADPDQFVRFVQDNDTQGLTHLPGIGKKTAERIIIEMRDRLADWNIAKLQLHASEPNASAAVTGQQAVREAVSALVTLGYKPPEASRMVAKIAQDNLTSEELIRAALKEQAK